MPDTGAVPSFIARASAYFHTVRHLRAAQVYERLWFRARRPRINLAPPPSVRSASGPWVEPAPHRSSFSRPQSFTFLNRHGSLANEGWDNPATEKLWRYNLHYFDDLTAADAPTRRLDQDEILRRWVRENRPGVGTGWEPYPTSLRIVNWVKRAWSGAGLPDECVDSLAVQARWLTKRLERHLLGNHLFANAKALVFAGLFFEGVEPTRWIKTGFAILRREIPEQIRSDGGHFELSPMYHALALEDMLDLYNATRAYADQLPPGFREMSADWSAVIPAMRRWARALSHPDGEVAFFNDTAIGVAPSLVDLERYADRLGVDRGRSLSLPLTALRETGYVRVERGPMVALLDVGEIGPAYLPAHGHADVLTFELSLFGERVVVNSGTSEYGNSAERLRQRGTAAHNTVVVDGRDSSEVWGGFRVARRAHPRDLTIRTTDGLRVACAHDGYERLAGRAIHRREWVFDDGRLTIHDHVTGAFDSAVARYHFHPGVRIDAASRGVSTDVRATLPSGRVARFTVERGNATLEASTWHPEFGKIIDASCLVVALVNGSASVSVWYEV